MISSSITDDCRYFQHLSSTQVENYFKFRDLNFNFNIEESAKSVANQIMKVDVATVKASRRSTRISNNLKIKLQAKKSNDKPRYGKKSTTSNQNKPKFTPQDKFDVTIHDTRMVDNKPQYKLRSKTGFQSLKLSCY